MPPAPSTSEKLLPSQAIFHALVAAHHLEPLPPWTLEHRLFREAVPGPGQSSTGYLQLLSLSHHDGNSYIGITKPEKGDASLGPATIATVPTDSGSDEFAHLVVNRFAPLWVRKQATMVTDGEAYEIETIRIRFGEIREAKLGQNHIRGTIVEVQWTGDDEDALAKDSLRQFWSELGFTGAKEFMQTSAQDDSFGSVRKWLEVMRLRA